MLRSIYLYNFSEVKAVQELIEKFQEDFDEILQDEFTSDELEVFEPKLEELANVYGQPIFSELKFEDFEVPEESYLKFKFIFESCKSCVVLENVADLYTNPFQVSYLMELMRFFDEGLIDLGNFQPLQTKQEFEKDLRSYTNMMNLRPKQFSPKKEIPTDLSPIERELLEIRTLLKNNLAPPALPEKTQHLLQTIISNLGDSNHVLRCSGMNPKDFTDNLEKLRLALKAKKS